MKKLFTLAFALISLTLFVSCEKTNTENTDDSSGDAMTGYWAVIYEKDGDRIYFYDEYTKDGKLIQRYLYPLEDEVYATLKNGTLTTPAGGKWKIDEIFSTYFIEGNIVWTEWGKQYRLTKIDNDTYSIEESDNSGNRWLSPRKYKRVKSIK